MLAARYGEECWQLVEGAQNWSSWWREVARIRDGVGVVGGGWFEESIVRKVGNKKNTFLWTDPQLGGFSLCVWFMRLFDLTGNKSSTVANMFALGWEEGVRPCSGEAN